jgi:hypothetical protein
LALGRTQTNGLILNKNALNKWRRPEAAGIAAILVKGYGTAVLSFLLCILYFVLSVSIQPALRRKKMNIQYGFLKVTTYLFLLVYAATLGVMPAVAQEAPGILDGKVFVGAIGDKGKEASDQDEIRFMNGRFHSVGCEEWGFSDAPYTARMDGDLVRFKAVTVSPQDGKIEWDGTVKGDTLEATYVLIKERWYWKDAHVEKWFNGSLK